MTDHHASTSSSQYSAASSIPLIKAPSLYLPKPVSLPSTIHPLPDDISAYFVYPFTLESHTLQHGPPYRASQSSLIASHADLLASRKEARERKEREEMRRRAPGWSGFGGGVLEFDRKGKGKAEEEKEERTAEPAAGEGAVTPVGLFEGMGGLAGDLAGLDLNNSSGSAPARGEAGGPQPFL